MAELPPCPDSPNCQKSNPSSHDKALQPWTITQPGNWLKIANLLAEQPNTTLTSETPNEIRLVETSSLFKFKDDIILQLSSDQVDFRSASRTGYYDFGANKKRLTRYYYLLLAEGLIE